MKPFEVGDRVSYMVRKDEWPFAAAHFSTILSFDRKEGYDIANLADGKQVAVIALEHHPKVKG